MGPAFMGPAFMRPAFMGAGMSAAISAASRTPSTKRNDQTWPKRVWVTTVETPPSRHTSPTDAP
jgi:hypothetical protein